jgi:hypothetical protein
MAKTYTAAGTVVAGDVATAAAWNVVTADVNNLIVPPAVRVIRTSTLSGYTSLAAVTWQSAAFDTDSMWSAGSPTVLTVQTTGIYLISLHAYVYGNSTITRILANINKNGTRISYQEGSVVSGQETSFMVSTVRSLTATDTISATFQYVGGSGYNISGNATETEQQPSLAMTWLGRTS